MSKQSWLDECYPIQASQVPVEDALQHAHRKWLGARPEVLTKHGLDEPPISFNTETCALCFYWRHYDEPWDGVRCIECPLYKTRGAPCDRNNPGLDPQPSTPYSEYSKWRNPEPMIALIEAAIATTTKPEGKT